jgi:hypothetical protein
MESVDKLQVEMDEMLLMYLEKVIDVLDDRVELMGIGLDKKMGTILIDVEVLLVFEHTLFDRIYTNFFHCLNFLDSMKLQLTHFCQNLEYINHAKEDYHLKYYEYHDMFLVKQVRILLADISLDEAKEKKKQLDEKRKFGDAYFDFIR